MSVKCILTNQFDKSKLNDYIAKKATYYPNDLNDSSLTDSPLLVDVSDTINTGLQTAIGDTLAYVIQVFQDDTTKMQLAVGYTNGRVASRINKEGVWTDWIAAVAASFPMTFSINESGGLVMIYDIPTKKLTIIDLNNNNLTYKYTENMTWGDFINSEYNDSKFTKINNGKVYYDYCRLTSNDSAVSDIEQPVFQNNLINNQKTYKVKSPGWAPIYNFTLQILDGTNLIFEYEEGMTWEKFIDSKYNDGKFAKDGSSQVKYDNMVITVPSDGSGAAYPYELINSTEIYEVFDDSHPGFLLPPRAPLAIEDITFQVTSDTIGAENYHGGYFEEGMTWGHFINSNYNDGKFTIKNIDKVYCDNYLLFNQNGTKAHLNELIHSSVEENPESGDYYYYYIELV